MSLFQTGSIYKDRFEIKFAVNFFNGELAVGEENGKKFYLQAANLHRQPPNRAIQQFLQLQSDIVLPYVEVLVDENYLVLVRPYMSIKPLRDVMQSEELSEEQVITWVKQLIDLELMLQSKAIPMYLLLDPRNIGVTEDTRQLQVIFIGLEKIMVTENKLDWGTFMYSLLSGQFLDGPIIRLPRDFVVSKPMMKLIQKTLKVHSVDQVIAQIDQYEKRKSGANPGNLISRFKPSTKDIKGLMPLPQPSSSSGSTHSPTPSSKPEPSTSDSSATTPKTSPTTPISIGDDTLAELVKMNENWQKSSAIHQQEEENDDILKEVDQILNDLPEPEPKEESEPVETNKQMESAVREENDDILKEVDQNLNDLPEPEAKEESEPVEVNKQLESAVQEVKSEFSEDPFDKVRNKLKKKKNIRLVRRTSVVAELDHEPEQENVNPLEDYYKVVPLAGVVEAESEEDILADEKGEEKESAELSPNTQTFRINPVLWEQLKDQDLSDSFIITLDQHRQEFQERQKQRLVEMRKKFEEQQRLIIEQRREEFEEQQRKILEEHRKELERQEQEILRKEREAIEKEKRERERKERERRRKEKARKARLEYERQLWEQKEKELMEKERKKLESHYQNLLEQMQREFEQKKQELLEKQKKEFEERRRKKIAKLREELLQDSNQSADDEEISFPITEAIRPVNEQEKAEKERQFLVLMGHDVEVERDLEKEDVATQKDQKQEEVEILYATVKEKTEKDEDNNTKDLSPEVYDQAKVEVRYIEDSSNSQSNHNQVFNDQVGIVSKEENTEKETKPIAKQIEEQSEIERDLADSQQLQQQKLEKKEEKRKNTQEEEKKETEREKGATDKKEANVSEQGKKQSASRSFSQPVRSMTRAERRMAARAALQQSFQKHMKKKEEKRKRKQERKKKEKLKNEEVTEQVEKTETRTEPEPVEVAKAKEETKQEKKEIKNNELWKDPEIADEQNQEDSEHPTDDEDDFEKIEEELFADLGNLFDDIDPAIEEEKEVKKSGATSETSPEPEKPSLEERLDELDRLLEEEEKKAAQEDADPPSLSEKPVEKEKAAKTTISNSNLVQDLQDYMDLFGNK